ncbi:MAG: PLDc_N domain-containing protein [Armatimonadetes bacterium]|nr:MAG: PLDc_N domain-containing protein [Armatimonadota bacterium]
MWPSFDTFTLLFLAVTAILWTFALVDCLRNEPSEGNEKLVWVVVILLTTIFGAVLYLLLRRPKRVAQYGQ